MLVLDQRLVCILVPLIACAGGDISFAQAAVSGTITAYGRPLADVTVRLQGHEPSVLTGPDGRFVLAGIHSTDPLYVTAAKPGYYNARTRLTGSIGSLQIELLPIPAADNARYAWQDPTPNSALTQNCGNCHSRAYAEWAEDGHSRAAVNPIVLDMYNGTDAAGRPNVRPGYRLDWSDLGNCASCHAPMMAARDPHTDLNKVEGVEKTGVSCDFCHKIKDVPGDPQFVHVADVRVLRPQSGQKLIFGPLDDAMFPGDIPDLSYSPVFNSSRLCAGCHDAAFWGTPVYETYTEWRKSAYANADVQCQDCHMRSPHAESRIADREDGGIVRRPGQIGSHRMMGESRTAMLKSSVRMETSALIRGEVLEVTVRIANIGAGHHLPTGQPMRNILLLVSPQDASGRVLRLLSGERVPVWGGNYSGRPGGGFAKVLATLNEYAKGPSASQDDADGGNFPAPFWRRNRIVSDNRIPAKAEVEQTYRFALTGALTPITLTSRLVYRRAFQPLAELKGWKLEDVELAVDRLDVQVQQTQP